MKNIVQFSQEISFNEGKTWERVSLFNNLYYTHPQEEIYNFRNFEQAYSFIEDGLLKNSTVYQTLFKKNKGFQISTTYRDFTIRVTQKTFKPFLVKNVFKKMDCSYFELQRRLSAEDFLSWLKDNNINLMEN